MGEGGVIQADRDAAADYFELIGETNRAIATRRGQYDLSACVQSHARHRQAAEKATRERDARIVETHPMRVSGMPEQYVRNGLATAIRSQNDG